MEKTSRKDANEQVEMALGFFTITFMYCRDYNELSASDRTFSRSIDYF